MIREMVNRTWNRLKQFGFYPLAIAITLPIVLLELYFFHATNVTEIFFVDSFLCLISIPNFFSNQLATAAYFGRTADMAFGKSQDKANKELIGTLVGIGAALFISLVLLGLGVKPPLVTSLGALADVFFILRYINICAGFGNRLGRYFDNEDQSRPFEDQSRPFLEKIVVLGFQCVGFLLGAGLFLASSAAAAQVLINGASLISFFTGYAGMPTLVSGIIFATSIGGLFGSLADYLIKTIGLILTRHHPVPPNEHDTTRLGAVHKFIHKWGRSYEYLGAAIGIGLGLLAAPYVIANLTAIGLLNAAGVMGMLTQGFIVAFTCSIYASSCSRLGRLVDAFMPNNSRPVANENLPHPPLDPFPGRSPNISANRLQRIYANDHRAGCSEKQQRIEARKRARSIHDDVMSAKPKPFVEAAPGALTTLTFLNNLRYSKSCFIIQEPRIWNAPKRSN